MKTRSGDTLELCRTFLMEDGPGQHICRTLLTPAGNSVINPMGLWEMEQPQADIL
jgi:hypothetical protein